VLPKAHVPADVASGDYLNRLVVLRTNRHESSQLSIASGSQDSLQQLQGRKSSEYSGKLDSEFSKSYLRDSISSSTSSREVPSLPPVSVPAETAL
jgi:hypothetical protein